MFKKVTFGALRGLAAWFICAAVLVFASAAIAAGMDDPSAVIHYTAGCALVLCSAVGGAVASRSLGDEGAAVILPAAVCGVLALIIMLAVGRAVPWSLGDATPAVFRAVFAAAVPAAAVTFAYIFRKRPRRRHRRHVRRYRP